MKAFFWFVVLSVVVSAWLPLSHCSKKPVGVARKEDIPYIKCQVCEKLAKQLYQQVQNKQAEIAPKKVLFCFWFFFFFHLGFFSIASLCVCFRVWFW